MQHTRLLGQANITKLLIKFSIPSIVSMLVVALYNLFDRLFISFSDSGTGGLSAVQIVFPYVLLITAFMMLISTGATTLISFALAEKDRGKAEKIIGTTLFMVIAVSTTITVLSFLFLEDFLRLLGADDNLLPEAINYFNIIVWGTIFMGISLGLNSCMRSEGHANVSMLTMITGGVLNLILDPLFILVLGMGTTGAAISTVLGQVFSAAVTIWFFVGGKSNLKLRIENLKPDFTIMARICNIGSAQFFLQLGTSIVTIIYNQSLAQTSGAESRIVIGAVGIVNNIAALVYMSITGIGQGMQPIIAYNYSAGNYNRVKRLLNTAFKFAAGIAVTGFLLAETFPGFFVKVFSGDSMEFYTFAEHATRIIFMVYPIIGFQIIASEYYQATGRGATAILLSLSRQVIALIPSVILLSIIWGVDGALFAAPVSDLIAFGIAMFFINNEIKQLDKGIGGKCHESI